MSKQTDKSLFIVSSLPRLYQALLGGIESYKDLGNRIISEIKLAHAFRQIERVSELSKILINIPIKEHKLIARYYLVWCECRERNYRSTALEQIIEQTQTYKAQALLTRGTFDLYQDRPEPALYFYREALKSSRNVPEFISVSLAIAQLKGIEGFNESALKDLEALIPLIKHADARLYYDSLNSYAVELGEAGRKYEARNVIQHVLESPFAIAYPEWQQTADELRGANRSFVVIDPSPARLGKLLSMPPVEHVESAKQDRPAPVVNLEIWKAKMGKKKNGKDKKSSKDISDKDMVIRLMDLSIADNMTYEKLSKILAYAEKVAVEPDEEE